jgi:hypothetical protein
MYADQKSVLLYVNDTPIFIVFADAAPLTTVALGTTSAIIVARRVPARPRVNDR